MAKPQSLNVGNHLTLTAARTKLIPRLGDTTSVYDWRPMAHKGLNVRRKIIAAKSAYVEVGDERSMLNYPKKSEYVESPGIITITYHGEPTAGAPGCLTELTYLVETP